MRAVGLGERCYEAMIKRSLEREVREGERGEWGERGVFRDG